MSRLGTVATAATLAVAGCHAGASSPAPSAPEAAASLSAPARLCVSARPTRPCFSADEVEGWLRDPALRILAVGDTPTGVQGARVFTLAAPTATGEVVFRAKWRPYSSTTWANQPRRELAAYAVQKLFLDPHEYVVPPTAGHCFPLRDYRAAVDAAAQPSHDSLSCVFGFLSYWLENVQPLEEAEHTDWFDADANLYDPDLFEEHPIYRRRVADVNLLTYLIRHADTHLRQFLIGTDPRLPVVYSVDNSMAFGVEKNSDLSYHDWSELKVPALAARSIDRLRAVTDADLARLALLEEYRRDERGVLVPIHPAPPLGNPALGLRWREGEFQVGLSADEIAALTGRLHALLARVEWEQVPLCSD